MKLSLSALTLSLLALAPAGAWADLVPSRPNMPPIRPVPPVQQHGGNRDPVALSRRDQAVSAQLERLRAGGHRDETAVQVSLGGQCGFAGCSSTTLVVFTFRSKGANTQTSSVLSLVTCPPVGDKCTVDLAEVRPAPRDPTQVPAIAK